MYSALRRTIFRRVEDGFVHVSCFQPCIEDDFIHRDMAQQPWVADFVKAGFDVPFEYPLWSGAIREHRCTLFHCVGATAFLPEPDTSSGWRAFPQWGLRQTPPTHPFRQWSLKPTGFSRVKSPLGITPFFALRYGVVLHLVVFQRKMRAYECSKTEADGHPSRPPLGDPDPFKEPQLLSLQRERSLTPQGLGPIYHHGFERVALNQRALRLTRGKRAWIKLADTDVFDLALAQVVVAVIFG